MSSVLNMEDYNQQMARIQGQIAALKSQPPVPYVAQPLQTSTPPPKQLNQAKGIEGAIKFQNDLSPGSNDVVFDEDTDHFYLISKDEDGSTPTKIRRYSFTLDEEIETTPVYITKADLDNFKEEIRMLLTKGKDKDE